MYVTEERISILVAARPEQETTSHELRSNTSHENAAPPFARSHKENSFPQQRLDHFECQPCQPGLGVQRRICAITDSTWELLHDADATQCERRAQTFVCR